MKVGITYNNVKGTITYNEDDLENFKVDFPDKYIKSEIIRYLHKETEYKIPESDEIDDYRIDIALPTDEITYFELSLCELFTHTGVWVDW